MFAFWPAGTSQQMLPRTFPQADWQPAPRSVSFPSSQPGSRAPAGCLAEVFCTAVIWGRELKRFNCLLGQGSLVPGRLLAGVSGDLLHPHRVWWVSCGAIHDELSPVPSEMPLVVHLHVMGLSVR